jgi:outer membrane receptor protein involved in Fe transport
MSWTDLARQGALLVIVAASLTLAVASDGEPLPIRLLTAEGDPVPYAQVSVVGRTGAVTTDAEGIFVLFPEPAAPFELAVFDQAGVVLGLIRVESLGNEGVRTLSLPPIEKVEVNVRGGVAPSTLAPPAAAATVVSRQDNQKRRPSQLAGIIAEAPGSGNVGSGHATVPSVRGLARGRTLVLLDHGRVTTERRAGPSATYLDPFVVENVEVVRGPGSVVYGSDPFGGIIHATTPSPTPDGFKGQVQAAAGAGENQVGGAIEANVPVGNGAILAAAYGRDFGNYDSPEGEVPNSGTRGGGMLLKGLIPGDNVRWVAGLQVDRLRDTGKPRLTDSVTSYPEENSDRATLAASFSPPGKLSSLELNVFLGRYQLMTERDERDGGAGGVFESDVQANDASLRLVATRHVNRGSLRAGVDTRSRFNLEATDGSREFDDQGQIVDSSSQQTIEDARQTDAGLFVEGERELGSGRHSLSAGLRGTYVTTSNKGGTFGDLSTSNTNFSGFFAYTLRPVPKWSTVFQVARGFREPFLSDRYFVGVTGRGFIVGNPDLEPETSLQFDVSLRRTGGVTSLAIYGYLYRIRDLVERYEVAPDVFNFRNRGEQEIRGIEIESDFDWGKAFSARVTANYAVGEILDDGSYPDDIPAPSIRGSAYGQPLKRLWWRAGYSYFFEDDRAGPTETEMPGYGVLDASVGYRFVESFETRLILGNILDETYPASPETRAVHAPGRSAILVLAGTF